MYLPNSQHNTGLHRAFRADGVLAGTNTPQLILPVAPSRAMFLVMNIGAHAMFLEHGPARFTATIAAGVVTAVTVTNGGFNYTLAPALQPRGGGGNFVANATWSGFGLLGSDSPTGLLPQGTTSLPRYARPAKMHAVLTSGVVTSVVIDDGGAGYINPPEIVVKNNDRDPFGCASPFYGSVNSGINLGITNGGYYINGTACWTDAISISGTAGDAFTVEYMI